LELVHATGVTKHYGGIAALSNATFQGRRGEVHALLGENGAGKSTFVQILAGAVQPDAAAILVNGEAFRASNPRQAQAVGISVVFQELSLIPSMTVEENIWFPREPRSRFRTVRRGDLQKATLGLLQRHRFPELPLGRPIRQLSLSDRQLVEIAKALARNPSVLILDEATSSLALPETEWLLSLTRRLAESGLLIIYISHRLGEVRRIADRVTVFRNGETVAVHETAKVDDETIITAMLGRRMERLYPERMPAKTSVVALSVRELCTNYRVGNVDLDLFEGEVLGVAGLQGHGQREMFHALFGISPARGKIELWGKLKAAKNPRDVLRGREGIALVPEDRQNHGLLLPKSVRENLTLSSIFRFTRFGFTNAKREAVLVKEMIEFLRIKAAPEQRVGTLSGGNQQKVIFGKMLLTEARVLLLYDPTRGIDVGTKGEIFQLMRDLCKKGYAILFYSSDLAELIHVADRVAVFRGGRVVEVFDGEALTERELLSAMLEKDTAATPVMPQGERRAKHSDNATHRFNPDTPARSSWWARWEDQVPFLVACALFMVLFAVYASLRKNVVTVDELNQDAAAAMALILAATGQTIVLLRGGIDLSIGGMISLGTVLAATRFGNHPGTATFWTGLILGIGLGVGMLNGLIIKALKLQPFLVTLATWSILSGVALLVLPTDGGTLPAGWMAFGASSFLGLSSSVWLLILLLLFWAWFRKTRLGFMIRAAGSNEHSAYLSGVSLAMVDVVTYGFSGVCAALAALYLTTQTGTGSPTIGKDYILPSVAAAVIGGVSLFGGRGGLPGTIVGALIMTLIGNLVFVLSVSSYWQPILSGVILLAAVLVGSLAQKSSERSVAE
jgi:ribose transport system ATP-binding protein